MMIKRGAKKLSFPVKGFSKAQFAMEVLMTWGWALMVVSAVFGALFYFDIFSLSDIKPDKCVLTPGILCDESVIHPGNFSIKVINSMGEDIKIYENSIVLSNEGLICEKGVGITEIVISNGASKEITIKCIAGNVFTEGHKQQFEVNFVYSVLGQDFNAQGKIFTNVAK